MNKKNLLLLVTTLFLANGFVLKTNAMEQQPVQTSSSGSKIEEIKEDVQMTGVEKEEPKEEKSKKRKRDVEDNGEAIEKRVKTEEMQIVPTSSSDRLALTAAFFSKPGLIQDSQQNPVIQRLINFIKQQNINAITALFLVGMNAYKNENGQNILHILSFDGKGEEIGYLFKNFKEQLYILINSFDMANKTPLFYGVVNGNLGVVRILIENGASKKFAWGEKQSSLLHLAAQNGYSEIIVFLLLNDITSIENKDTDGKNLLHVAIERGFDIAVKAILDTLIRTNNKSLLFKVINAPDKGGKTCLHYAMLMDNLDIVKNLLKNGSNVNAQDINKSTPLHILLKNDSGVENTTTGTVVDLLLANTKLDVTKTDMELKKSYDYLKDTTHPIFNALKQREQKDTEKYNCIIQ